MRETLRIGIDATAIPLKRVGAGNYIFNLVRSLANVDHDNDYIVFARPEHTEEWGIRRRNFRFIQILHRARGTRVAWEQFVLPRELSQCGADILHSPHYTMPLLNSCRSVVTFCDMTFFLYPEMHTAIKRRMFRWIMRRSARRAARIITISKNTADDVTRVLGVPKEKMSVVPLGVSPAYRPITDEQVLRKVCGRYSLVPHEYLLYVGVLEPRKNVPRLLHAYALLRRSGVRHPLVLVGRRGWKYDDVFRTLEALGLGNDVVFTDHVPEGDLPALYCGARVFVYPSMYEGFGLPVLEAMACGVPVVTSDTSSMPEVLGDAGVLIDPHDHEAIAAGIRRVLDDGGLEETLRARGPVRAAFFSWERTAVETVRVYTQACALTG